MKKILSLICALALIGSAAIMPMTVNAECVTYKECSEYLKNKYAEWPDREADHETVTENGLVFNVYDGYAYFTECKDTEAEDVTIPDKINGVDVVGIYGNAFGYCRNLVAVTLPDTMRYFNWSELVTPVTKLGSNEDPVPSIMKVRVSDTNPYYTLYGTCIYSKDMKTLVGCPPAIGITDLTIPKETDTIGECAFYANISLENADIPENITTIKHDAFTGCAKLKKVTLPKSITEIQSDTFVACPQLSEVEFKGDIKAIGGGAFAYCPSLKKFTIPDTVTYVGVNAFENSGCIEEEDNIYYVDKWCVGGYKNKLDKVSIRNGTVGIAEWSFILANRIELFEVPETVKYTGMLCYQASKGNLATINYRGSALGETSFSGVKKLKDIYFYNKDCEIFDSEDTIPATWTYKQDLTDYDALIRNEEKEKSKSDVRSGSSSSKSVYVAVNTQIVDLDDEEEDENEGYTVSYTQSEVEKKVDAYFKEYSAPYSKSSVISADEEEADESGDTVIHGYAGSTAEAYARKYNRKFELIEEATANKGTVKLEKTRIQKTVRKDGSFEIYIKGFEKPFIAEKDSEAAKGIAEHPLYAGDIVSGVLKTAEDGKTITGIDVNKDSLGGDSNCDNSVDMSDAVIIMQALANPNKYGENGTHELHLTAEGKSNADIEGDEDGMTNLDALAIQKRLLMLD